MDNHNDDHAVIEAGYKPQLHRSLGLFSSFAIPFSEISITTGIFANFAFVLTKAGPFGFWTWPLVAFGQTLVALVFAEMAGRIPLTGSCYNWNNKLAHPAIGWLTGWLSIFVFAIGTASVTTTMLPVLSIMMGRTIDAQIGSCIVSGLILVQMLFNLQGVRLTSHTNIVAVIAEIASIALLGVFIAFAVASKGHFNFDLLTKIPSEPHPYWPGFLMASLLGAWTFIGFECSADVSEETINAKRVTPKGIISAVLASAVIGFAFIVVMALAIPDLAAITKADYPLAAISSYYLGDTGTNLFLAFALVSMFACSMVVMTAGSRNLFAIARDKRFIASSFFSQVSSHHVPKNAIFLVAAVGIVAAFMADSATVLYGAGTVCVFIYYLLTVISFAAAAPNLPKTDTFSLGRWHWPVVILAALWLVVGIGILTIPEEFHSVAKVTGYVMIVGLVLYLFVGRVQKPFA